MNKFFSICLDILDSIFNLGYLWFNILVAITTIYVLADSGTMEHFPTWFRIVISISCGCYIIKPMMNRWKELLSDE